MKGATAEPLTSTATLPNVSIMTRIGRSQNFLRTRMKRQSSAKKSMCMPSELIFHCDRCRPRRPPGDPITVRIRFQLEPQQIPAHGPHHKSGRQHGSIENEAHYDRIDDLMEQESKFEPCAVE